MKAAEPYSDFVQVVALNAVSIGSKGGTWAALRANGDVISSDGSVQSGRIGLFRSEAYPCSVLSGGIIADSTLGAAPREPVLDYAYSHMAFLASKSPAIAYADLQGIWHIQSPVFDSGLMEKPDIISTPKVTQVIMGNAGIAVLREDGSLRFWASKEIPLPNALAKGVRAVVPVGQVWFLLKTNGEVRTCRLQGQTQVTYDALPKPEVMPVYYKGVFAAIAYGGYDAVLKQQDGRWCLHGRGGIAEEVLAKLRTENNESFSIMRTQGGDGVVWIEPVK